MNLDKLIKRILKEATSDGGGRGSYLVPLQPGVRRFKKTELDPFNIQVSKYDSPFLEYDSYDGKMETSKKNIKKFETKAKKATNRLIKNPFLTFSDDDGNIINPTPGKKKKFVPINEADTSISAGLYNGPIELGLKKWDKHVLSPFSYEVDHTHNQKIKEPSLRGNIKRKFNVKELKTKTLSSDIHPVHTVNEDLAVWFGKKKKPKGSSQPKGPWVDICRRVDGKHPPCGRSDADKGSYPKCRAAGVAGKMSDSQKKSACQQKRKAERNDPQRGKGQKPVMTSYKTKKESIDSLVGRIISEIRNSF